MSYVLIIGAKSECALCEVGLEVYYDDYQDDSGMEV